MQDNSGAAGESGPLQAEMASLAHGRIRVRMRQSRRRGAELARLQERLQGRQGISGVEVNPRTGSVLVHYHPPAVSHEGVLNMLRDVGVVFGAITGEEPAGFEETGPSDSASSLMDAVDDLDRRLARATKHRVDLKTVFPLTLTLLGVRQAFRQRLGVNSVPAYILFWYAFDSFWKFHRTPAAPLEHDDDAGEDSPA